MLWLSHGSQTVNQSSLLRRKFLNHSTKTAHHVLPSAQRWFSATRILSSVNSSSARYPESVSELVGEGDGFSRVYLGAGGKNGGLGEEFWDILDDRTKLSRLCRINEEESWVLPDFLQLAITEQMAPWKGCLFVMFDRPCTGNADTFRRWLDKFVGKSVNQELSLLNLLC